MRKIVDQVHASGSHLFIQLMHAGRMSHPDNTPHHRQPVAPKTQMLNANGMLDIPVPRELSQADIKETVEDFRIAAATAIKSGADGVEIHGANSYPIHQFISEHSNLYDRFCNFYSEPSTIHNKTPIFICTGKR